VDARRGRRRAGAAAQTGDEVVLFGHGHGAVVQAADVAGRVVAPGLVGGAGDEGGGALGDEAAGEVVAGRGWVDEVVEGGFGVVDVAEVVLWVGEGGVCV
jgi:hypothetical protein